jgi:hypothetical protein
MLWLFIDLSLCFPSTLGCSFLFLLFSLVSTTFFFPLGLIAVAAHDQQFVGLKHISQ